MNKKVVIAVCAIGIISAIAAGIFSTKIILGLILAAAMFLFIFLAVCVPIIVLRLSAPELPEEEIERMFLQSSCFFQTSEFSPFYPGPSGIAFRTELESKNKATINYQGGAMHNFFSTIGWLATIAALIILALILPKKRAWVREEINTRLCSIDE
jgi:hypothetical protein